MFRNRQKIIPQNVSNHVMEIIESNVLATSLSLKTIGFGLFGTIFCGAVAYIALPTSKMTVEGVSYETGIRGTSINE